MKPLHLIFFILMILSLGKVSCQDFAPIGAEWHYTERFAFSYNVSYLQIKSIGDTVIQGKPCRILENNGGLLCAFHNIQDYVYSEDSIVFFYVPEIDSFQILYDLRAEKGSSWIVVFNVDLSPVMDTVLIGVDSVATVSINGHSLKKFFVHYEHLNGYWSLHPYYGVIVEGIGDTYYLFNLYTDWAICDGNYSGGLRCYEDSIIGHYSTGIADSCTYSYDGSGIDAYDDALHINTFPIPTRDLLFMQSEIQSELEYRLFNFSGNLMIEDKMCREGKLDLSQLPSGVYFLEFRNTHKRPTFRRIIKI